MQAVAYRRPSVLESSAAGRRLGLETSQGATPSGAVDHPRFFAGFLTSPRTASAGLLAVADVAAARYFQPQLRASPDPVVTGNGDRLRFESFSGCGGVYARLDVLEAGLDGGEVGLGTQEGARLARWLTAEGPALPVSRRTCGPRVLIELGELPDVQDGLPAPLRVLGRPVSVFRERWYCHHWNADIRQHWPALLPERPEPVAARILRDLSAVAVDDARGAAAVLPQLAETDGVAGEAVHLCVAYGLGARHAEDRLAAVDALLVLAARGRLDPGLLGADLGQLVRRGAVKAVRLAESVRTAAATDANATIWSVLRHTLPVLLADLAADGTLPSSRGLGDLLAVAAECVERTGARGELPHLARAADRRGSSRLVTQARRLRSALTDTAVAA
ncbi:hypothetical protein GCM10010377_16480 [Streptomyces viridiviolaceus]|nr:hypothetical protein GCM10010377_16480 [Streptomyces viridiviolaceus]